MVYDDKVNKSLCLVKVESDVNNGPCSLQSLGKHSTTGIHRAVMQKFAEVPNFVPRLFNSEVCVFADSYDDMSS